jgi:hypothetical protein
MFTVNVTFNSNIRRYDIVLSKLHQNLENYIILFAPFPCGSLVTDLS